MVVAGEQIKVFAMPAGKEIEDVVEVEIEVDKGVFSTLWGKVRSRSL